VAFSGSIGDEVRAICLALPGVTERTSHGAPRSSPDGSS